MIQNGALRQHGSGPAQRENAAQVAMAGPLLIALRGSDPELGHDQSRPGTRLPRALSHSSALH
jgi:hypothetical protein